MTACAPGLPCIDITSFAYRSRTSNPVPAGHIARSVSTQATVAALAPGNSPPAAQGAMGRSRPAPHWAWHLVAGLGGSRGGSALPHAATPLAPGDPDKMIPTLEGQLRVLHLFLHRPLSRCHAGPPELPAPWQLQCRRGQFFTRFKRRAAWYCVQNHHLPTLRASVSMPNWGAG